MIKLITKLFFFILLISITITIVFYCFYKIGGNDLPAPNYSNSISFNEKIDFIRSMDISETEYIVLGSSMALNNFDSETMVNNFGENYLNLASWGFKMSDTKKFLENMLEYFPNLKTVILSSNLMDYSDKRLMPIEINYSNVTRSLDYFPGILSYFIKLDLKYLLSNSRTNQERMYDNVSYQSLKFDENGGVILNISKDDIDKTRWTKNLNEYQMSESEMRNLDEITNMLSDKKIKLCVAISPLRPGAQSSEEFEKYLEEIEKIETRLDKKNVEFINCNNTYDWNDSLFVDYAHLNKKGTKIYTDFIVKLILK